MSLAPKSLGFVNVGVPGTPVQLSVASKGCYTLRLQPRQSAAVVNVGNIYIGGSNLNKAIPGSIYAILSPEQVEGREFYGVMQITDISDWWIDADNAGDGVLIGYLVPK